MTKKSTFLEWMNTSMEKGLSFGITSGVITTLGLMVGLFSGTASKKVVLGGILTIAIADAMSDALGIHVSEESSNVSHAKVWAATISTFGAKFLFAMTFVLPVLIFGLQTAVIVSVLWGLSALVVVNYLIAKKKGKEPSSLIF